MRSDEALRALSDEACAAGRAAGLDVVGVAGAEPFDDVRRTLEQRKRDGLHGGMAFTYRNPARSTDPSRSLEGAAALVVGARSYHREPPVREPPPRPSSLPSPSSQRSPSSSHNGPTNVAEAPVGVVARYSWEDHYEPLRDALEAVAMRLRSAGYRAVVLVDDNALVDRAAAHRAGLGWYGKNANLLLPGLGSWFVLGSVVTDAPLPPTATEPAADGCGTCDRCLPACPTGAIVAPGVIDARRCLAWLLEAPGVFPVEHRVALGGRIYGCDECQEACPPNRLAIRRSPSPPAAGTAEPTVDLLDLLDRDTPDADVLGRFARWYVPKRERRYLERNALVAIGNVGHRDDPRTRAAVTRALADDDPLVRGHAVWAAARLGGFADELDALDGAERDAMVRTELANRPPDRPG